MGAVEGSALRQAQHWCHFRLWACYDLQLYHNIDKQPITGLHEASPACNSAAC